MRQHCGPVIDLKPLKGFTGEEGSHRGMWTSSLLIQRRMSDSHEERLTHRDVHVTHLYTLYATEFVMSETLQHHCPSKATSTLFNRKWASATAHLDAADRPPLWSSSGAKILTSLIR